MRPTLDDVVSFLEGSESVRTKLAIRRAYSPAIEVGFGAAALGDDCAAIPDPAGGYLLLAAEGLLERFVAEDPWFAGYSAVMVNISDVCAMGGRPVAVVDVLWAPGYEQTEPVWDGMKAAARDYNVPIVGGHTTISGAAGPVYLAACILGRANALLTSFDAMPGDSVLMAVDLAGSYRGDKPFWNASAGAPPERLQQIIGLLPEIAGRGWCRAAKDISNGGVVGTLAMLLECSRCGAVLDLDELPIPPAVDLRKWVISFPSYGYLLSAPAAHCASIIELFRQNRIDCRKVGEITAGLDLELRLGGNTRVYPGLTAREQVNA